MGRRSRKRATDRAGGPTPAPPSAEPPPRTAAAQHRRTAPGATRKSRLEEAPPAPWSPFPLVELTILAGIVLIVLGFLGIADRRGLFLACGVALVSLATLELSLREHFAGYRSHSTLLAAVAGILAAVPLSFLTSWPFEVIGVISLLVFAAAFAGLRSAFRRRTGGIGFRA